MAAAKGRSASVVLTCESLDAGTSDESLWLLLSKGLLRAAILLLLCSHSMDVSRLGKGIVKAPSGKWTTIRCCNGESKCGKKDSSRNGCSVVRSTTTVMSRYNTRFSPPELLPVLAQALPLVGERKGMMVLAPPLAANTTAASASETGESLYLSLDLASATTVLLLLDVKVRVLRPALM